MKKTLFLLVIFLAFVAVAFLPNSKTSNKPSLTYAQNSQNTFWKYQCVDTMKISRDKARNWDGKVSLETHIDREMQAIADMGGNCVAIDTPYDNEFLAVLKKWVEAARNHDLKIWFRGNFSGWEGWFDYPKGMTAQLHNQKTYEFITTHPELFKDGDIFTPSPEAENGGPFNQVEKDEHQIFRQYLISEYQNAGSAFKKINKRVELNWLSMNGGLAKRMLDKPTVDRLDKVVALDHYIKTAPEMSDYINYFANNFGAKVVIGEFGAPIPDINGSMTESKQAEFIDGLFYELYKNKDRVEGINYWTLYDGSTALYNPDFTPRKVVEVIQYYFIPLIIEGDVVNDLGEKIDHASVETEDKITQERTDKNGHFRILVPSKKINLHITYPGLSGEQVTVSPNPERRVNLEIKLFQNNPDFAYQLKKFYNKYLKFF